MNRLTDEDAFAILERRGAYLKGLHVVYTSGMHGHQYINKDAALPHVPDISRLCEELAYRTAHLKPDVVIGPVAGAVALSHWVAHHLSQLLGREILAVYADRRSIEQEMVQQERDELLKLADLLTEEWPVGDGERTAVARKLEAYAKTVRARPKCPDEFLLKRGYDKLVAGQKALIVDDIVNTGGSIRETAIAAANAEAEIVGGCSLANRGEQTAESLRFPSFTTLVNIRMDAWKEDEMPDWLREWPVDTHVGKGMDYLRRKGLLPG